MSINTNPIDTTPNTPLDAIKGAYLRAHDRIGDSLDGLIGMRNMPEDAVEIALLDSADRALALLVCEALGYDKPDRNWVPTRETAPELYRYDDDTPVFYGIAIGPHVQMDIWPRFDTKESVQAVLGYSIDLAFSNAEGRAAKAAAESAADALRAKGEGDAA
ncbi:hypothetical protein [Curtobacterium sp. VKM Ac-1376]|uniref:hypothetical protein n=1 Tax=Curtobacterium sp. VKM Ac-1376 TaxID=123312 RepID=UPI00188A9FBD|nr:hypothetical protein [Curtobacterium sp. VKM Ac-1376]MBF4613770.1 hypothetical protein [Curtobacterium sp. VKM Ac-1376]